MNKSSQTKNSEFTEFSYNLLKNLMMEYPELVQEMKSTDHNSSFFKVYSDWHLEGSVWTHTMMVFSHMKENCKDSSNWKELMVCALLHDIGKIHARFYDKDKRKVRFFGHAGISTFMAKEIVQKLVPEFTKNQLICTLRLINYHDILFDVRDTDSRNTDLSKSAKIVFDKFNSYLGANLLKNVNLHRIADTKGCVSINEPGTSVQINKLLESLYYHNLTNYSWKPNQTNSKPKAIFMVGLPGCGKSTYIQKNCSDYLVVSRDAQIHKLEPGLSYHDAWEKVDQNEVNKMFEQDLSSAISSNKNIIIDMTNLTYKGRRKFYDRLKSKYSVKNIVLMPDFSVVLSRNSERTGKVIPKDIIINMMKNAYLPFENEPETEYIFNF